MKISEMGVFILYINNFQQYILEDEINLICIDVLQNHFYELNTMQITKEFCVSVDDSNENICLPVKGKYVSHKM